MINIFHLRLPCAFLLMILTASVNGNPLQYSFLENPMDGGAW